MPRTRRSKRFIACASSRCKQYPFTAYHIQNNCLSGVEKRTVPVGTACITVGADVQKLGLHWVAIVWREQAAGCIADYDFFEFLTEGRVAADCELKILEGLFAWREAQQQCLTSPPKARNSSPISH